MNLSNIAEVSTGKLFSVIKRNFVSRHGNIAGSDLSVIALGKLGGREMSPLSDLDFIFVYDIDNEKGRVSDGKKPLSTPVYFSRLIQRFVSALTTTTSEGSLYDVDMRLRPSGHSGPVACSLSSFVRYQKESAWTWEHMALCRARVIHGSFKIRKRLQEVINESLTQKRDQQKLKTDILEMREKIRKQHKAKSVWDFKYMRGGLVDIEFVTQYLQLLYAHENNKILRQNTLDALEALCGNNYLQTFHKEHLQKALCLWHDLHNLLSIIISDYTVEKGEKLAINSRLPSLIFQKMNIKRTDELEKKITETALLSYEIFQEILEKKT